MQNTNLPAKAEWKIYRLTHAIQALTETVKSDPSRQPALESMKHNLAYWKEIKAVCLSKNEPAT